MENPEAALKSSLESNEKESKIRSEVLEKVNELAQMCMSEFGMTAGEATETIEKFMTEQIRNRKMMTESQNDRP